VKIAGRYELTERIATGGMGEVWRARDEVLSRVVAVKVLKPEYAEDASFLARFRNEAKHTAALSHPGIANVFDYGEVDNSGAGDENGTGSGPRTVAYLVMEHVEGEPLSALLGREGPLQAARTLDIVGQAALALQAAHAAGVVHRDVKPGNLLIRPDGVVKVTDFGIARAIDSAPVTQTGLVVGTAHYLSPEQAAGKPVTPASDIYALGVVTYECLTGRRPFDEVSPVAVAMAHMSSRPPALPKDVPPLVADFVDRALDKDPARRQPDAGDFGRTALALAATLREAPPAGEPAAAPTVPAQPDPVTPHPVTKVLTAFSPVPTAGGTAADAAADDDRERRRIRNIFVAVGAAVVLLGFLLLHSCGAGPSAPGTAATPTPSSTPSVATVTVVAADYLGRPVDAARAALTSAGLRVRVTSVESGAAAGSVVGVSPTGTVRRGATITLTVATAPPAKPAKGKGKGRHGGDGGH
jgi:serine/threonine-protein kinase